MSKSIVFYLFSLSLITVFSSCQKDQDLNEFTALEVEEEVQKSYAGVDSRLWSYFQEFEEAALSRGYLVDLEGADLTGGIEEIAQQGVAGQCTYNSQFPNNIIIDETFWNSASSLYREFVIFHELGHCFLGRNHRESMHANGTCLSIMRSGLGECQDNYYSETRSSYLDELFDFAN